MRALGNENHRVQSHAVAHPNHDIALRVIETVGNWFEFGGRLAWIVGVFRPSWLRLTDSRHKHESSESDCCQLHASLPRRTKPVSAIGTQPHPFRPTDGN